MSVPGLFPSIALLHAGGEFAWTRWVLEPSILLGCGLLLAGYAWAIGPLRRRVAPHETIDEGKAGWFILGVAIMFVGLNGPLHDLSDYFLFSAHMVQHMLIMLFMPPLLLMGLPEWLLSLLFRRPAARAVGRFLTHPLVAFGIYNVVFAGWHVPRFYNWALEDHNVHVVQHLMFMASATIMWWPVIEPAAEIRRINTPVRLLYLFALGIPMSIVSAIISLSETVLYPFYAAAPRVFEMLTPLDDQQLGGLIMWVPGALVFWGAITIIFFKWSNGEEREEWREREALKAAAG